LFAGVPFAPDVIQWHVDEITELPTGAVLLAASTHYPVQAFRIGPVAWGTQFHIECDTEMFADWAIGEVGLLADLGLDGVELVAGVDAVLDDVAEVWEPFAERFAAVALGTLPIAEAETRFLPLLGS
jgi:GMP synthase-like glutamine amidotransferase